MNFDIFEIQYTKNYKIRKYKNLITSKIQYSKIFMYCDLKIVDFLNSLSNWSI